MLVTYFHYQGYTQLNDERSDHINIRNNPSIKCSEGIEKELQHNTVKGVAPMYCEGLFSTINISTTRVFVATLKHKIVGQ